MVTGSVRNSATHTEGLARNVTSICRQDHAPENPGQIVCGLQAHHAEWLTSGPYFCVIDDRASRWCDGVASKLAISRRGMTCGGLGPNHLLLITSTGTQCDAQHSIEHQGVHRPAFLRPVSMTACSV
jgi:hypothetical protein